MRRLRDRILLSGGPEAFLGPVPNGQRWTLAVKAMEKHRKDIDLRMRFLSIMRHLHHDRASTPFWELQRGSDDDNDVGEAPTDLRNIALCAESADTTHFVEKVEAVWANCEAYGPAKKSSALKIAAAGCKATFDRLYSAWVEAPDRPEDPNLFSCRACTIAKRRPSAPSAAAPSAAAPSEISPPPSPEFSQFSLD